MDIVQAVGRAIRKSEAKAHGGVIVLPVFIGEGDDAQAALESSRFKPVWDALNALRSHDDIENRTTKNTSNTLKLFLNQ